jgi:flagellar biosynthesis activator protein FlaF
MHGAQLETYRNMQKATLSGRELEAEVLSKAAFKLNFCQNNWNDPKREERLEEALKYNQKIWTLFQAELAKPDNPLPKKLREDLLSLSAFVDKRIFELMSFPTPEKLTAVININLNLAAGLRGKVT